MTSDRPARLLLSAFALSLDNLVVGFALGAYQVSLLTGAAIFGAVSVVMTLAGLELGARIGRWASTGASRSGARSSSRWAWPSPRASSASSRCRQGAGSSGGHDQSKVTTCRTTVPAGARSPRRSARRTRSGC